MKKTFFTVASILLSAAMIVGLSSCKNKEVSQSEEYPMQPEQVEDYNDYISDFEEAYSIEEMDEEYVDDYVEETKKQVKEAVKQVEAEVEKATKAAEAEVEKAIEQAEAELEEAIGF